MNVLGPRLGRRESVGALAHRAGWVYLAAVQDAFSRTIVGWAMAEHMRSDLVVDALQMALARRQPEAGLIHHSDQGSQPGLNRSSQHRFPVSEP